MPAFCCWVMTNRYRFEFRLYNRSFKQPLQTHHGMWRVRQGIILKLTDTQGQVGWGEIAPIAAFGTESLKQALDFCRSLPAEIPTELIMQIPATLPACQFGFEAALETMRSTGQGKTFERKPLTCSHLLPTGLAALTAWQLPYQQGNRTFKWKIGVAAIETELQQFEQLVQSLPTDTCLRLDANGGLQLGEAYQWLQRCDACRSSHRAEVELLEQPLPPSQFEPMLALSQQFETPIALDESVAILPQLQACYQQGWRGIFVIKAAIAGSPQRLRQFCQQHPIDIVWSSVFETTIAQHFIKYHLIASVPLPQTPQRAIGFGVNQWFTDSHLDQLGQSNFEQLWSSL